MTPEQIEQMEAALEGATPSPWQADDTFMENRHTVRVAMPDVNGIPAATIAETFQNWFDVDADEDRRISWKEAENNAALMALAPDMADHIIAQREQIEALQKLATDLDSFITEHASAIQRDQTDEETLAAAEDFRSDWFGGGWGASTRDQLAAYRATGRQDNE